MKTPEQLKGAIRNIAKEKDLHAQEQSNQNMENKNNDLRGTFFPILEA